MGSTFGCHHLQINNLWSVWYCTMALAFQIYIIVISIRHFTEYISLPWPIHDQPYFELNAYVGFIGAAVVMLPFFVVAALLKIGNYANDGYKLGGEDHLQSAVYQNLKRKKCTHWLRTIWRHGGPTAPFLHLAAAFCLLLPRLLIHAQLIKHGFVAKDGLWKTDLDFLMTHRERLVALSFLSTVNETELWQRESADLKNAKNLDMQLDDIPPISSEYLNYATALLVYAVRYPSVFWKVNKCFGLIFSFQLILNGLQQLLSFTGFAVLYKVQIYGPRAILLRFTPLLLNVPLSVLLFLVYNIVMTLSGSVLYMYGLQKHREWLDRDVQKHHVTWKNEAKRLWGYIPHVSAFLVVLMIALSAAPLMYDYTLVYCGSLDGAVLAAVTGTVMHLFLWIVFWLMLTVKQKWSFNSESMPYSHSMCNGYAGKAANENIEGYRRGKEAPLLVIDNGQTFQVREKMSKKAILSVAQKSVTTSRKQPTPSDDDDIYWLKPKPPSPKDTKSSPETDRLTWLKNQRKSPGTKHKVTFEEGLLNSNSCKRTRSLKSPKTSGKHKKNVKLEDLSDSNSEEGDYATLKDLPPPPRQDEDGFEVQSQEDTTNMKKLDDGDYELLLEENPPLRQINAPVIVHNVNGLIGGNITPKSTRSTDSGASKGSMDQNLTPRSGSVSETSTTPDRGGGSDSSSGVHSNSSGGGDKRSTSMENLTPISFPRHAWKSMSLQRNIATPGVLLHGSQTYKPDAGIYYDPRETTMVIWRKPKLSKEAATTGEPFGRATNIRMTSFSDQPDYGPKTTPTSPRQMINQNRNHTLGHYSKPLNPHLMMAPGVQMQRRDSANYSLTSSGESDNYMSQC